MPIWIVAGAAVVVCVGGAALWWLRRNIVQVTIDGDSMLPTFHDGEVVLAKRTKKVRAGDVVAVVPLRVDAPALISDSEVDSSAGSVWIIKRVAAAAGDCVPNGLAALADRAGEVVPEGFAVLLGDNPDQSHDSRQQGLFDLNRLRGKIIRSNP